MMMNGKANLAKTPPQPFSMVAWVCIITGLVIVLGGLCPSPAGENRILLGFRQTEDSESIPEGWELITYPGRAKNTLLLVAEGKKTVLHVKSLGSASALVKRPEVDIREFPILVWRWKINRVVGMAVESQRDRNDSAARVRVIFGKGAEKPSTLPPEMEEFIESLGIKRTPMEPPGFKIDYIWGNRLPQGKTLDFPGSRNHKVVVIQSGNDKANQWVWEERNLIEDYESLFEAAPADLAGIVILTDTDNTNEGVEACYSSVVLMSQ